MKKSKTYGVKLTDVLTMAQKIKYLEMIRSGNYDPEIAAAVHDALLSIRPGNVKEETAREILNSDFVHVSYDMSAKLKGVPAISTSNLFNSLCQIFKKCDGAICGKCFADGQQRQYYCSLLHCVRNLELIACGLVKVIPTIAGTICRIEAFGDIVNEKHANFYIDVIEHNKHCNFGWWSKHPELIEKALKDHGYTKETGKPENMRFILSSLLVNKKTTSRYWFTDRDFTVYDKETIKKENIKINCGGAQCVMCRDCYDSKNYEEHANEEMK